MNLREFSERLAKITTQLSEERERNAFLISADLAASVKLRIQKTGVNSEGQQFEDYTSVYTKRRRKDGFQARYIDFTRTGRMFASIQPRVTSHTDAKTAVTIKAGNSKEQTKLNGQARKRGNILLPTDEEIQQINELNRQRVIRVVNENI